MLCFASGFLFIFMFYNLLRCAQSIRHGKAACEWRQSLSRFCPVPCRAAAITRRSHASRLLLTLLCTLRSLGLQRCFYVQAADSGVLWRIQRGGEGSWKAAIPPPVVNLLLSLLGVQARADAERFNLKRAPDHDLISTINLVTASAAAGSVFEATARGSSGITFDVDQAGGVGFAALSTVGAICWQLVLEYYWHRLMHLPPFYKRFHKV